MSDELLGYTEMDGDIVTHLAPVRDVDGPKNLRVVALCHNILPRSRSQLGRLEVDWKQAEATYKSAIEARTHWLHQKGLCRKCWVRIDALARREQKDAGPKHDLSVVELFGEPHRKVTFEVKDA